MISGYTFMFDIKRCTYVGTLALNSHFCFAVPLPARVKFSVRRFLEGSVMRAEVLHPHAQNVVADIMGGRDFSKTKIIHQA